MLATIEELKSEGIKIHPNQNTFGIPQGTPISAVFANLYLRELDKCLANACAAGDAFYRRYSDDIVLICHPENEQSLTQLLLDQVKQHKLEISSDKTERIEFDPKNPQQIQYLGFNLSPQGVSIRENSLGRQWRKLRRGIKRAKRAGEAAIAAGKASKVFTKKLRRRFSSLPVRNFSSYARRSSEAFQSKKIAKQVRRLERHADRAIRDLNS